MPQDDDFITVAGAARLARVSQGTIRRWLTEGKITKYVDGRKRVWVDRNQVLKLIKRVPETNGAGA